MKIANLWKSFGAMCFALVVFGTIPGAMAGVYGSVNLDITDGTFAYDSTGASTIIPLVGPQDNYVELVTGSFAYSNTLPPSGASFNYSGSATVDVNGGTGGGGLTIARSMNFGYTSLNSIIGGSPDAAAAFTLVSMLSNPANTTGNTTFTTSVGNYNFSWAYIIDALTANGGNGRFNMWSKVDYSGSANPAFLVFPANATFTMKAVLNAVPEPGMLGLLGLGLLAFGWRRSRKA